jgi:5,10-methylenetetrahydromethanopterin reductase
MYTTMALCAQATQRVLIGPTVTNPITRHPAVAASGIATIDEIAPGRAIFGIGSGDSAILNLAERPATLADLRAYVGAVRDLHTRREAEWRGRTARLTWAPRPVPIYLSAEGRARSSWRARSQTASS